MTNSFDSSDISRRGFLTRFGVAAAALASTRGVVLAQDTATSSTAATTSTAALPPVPEAERVGWAIAGIGNFATGPILPNIRQCRNTRVTGFITRDPAGKGQKFAAEYGVNPEAVVSLENMQRLADRKDIEVVYVITPNGLHKDYALAALKAGKHVFCEKPFAPTVADCQEMIDAAKKANRLIGIGYRMKFDPHNIKAIETIREGGLGKLKFISGEFGFSINTSKPHGVWRVDKVLSGGGSLADIGVYGINAARFLTGEEPVRISGHVHSTEGDPRFTEVEETALFRFEFPSGVQLQAMSSYGIAGVNRFRAIGDSAWLDMEPAISYEGGQMTLSGKGGKKKLEPVKHNMFIAMMDNFSDAVRGKGQPRSTGEDGLRDVRYINAVYDSAREGGKIISL